MPRSGAVGTDLDAILSNLEPSLVKRLLPGLRAIRAALDAYRDG